MNRDKRLRLFIDVGTNCEIALGSADRLVCTAAPAGPAFEAAQIRCGMRAADGAIEVVRIGDDALELEVIGEVEPLGICGSGLVDCGGRARPGRAPRPLGPLRGRTRRPRRSRQAVAPARRARRAASGSSCSTGRASEGDVENAVYLSQRDVRELQFAKAAIATGWKLLVEELGIEESEIQQVLLAGSFGSYLSPASAVRIGLVPRLPAAAHRLGGQRRGRGREDGAALDAGAARGDAMLEEVEYVELSDRADFNDRFIEQLAFPEKR